MALGTKKNSHELELLYSCYIKVNDIIIFMKVLPDIQDQKDASFGEEIGIGRSMPIKTFGSGGNRTISWGITFIAETEAEAINNIVHMRLLQSCTYPRNFSGYSLPYAPPTILKIRCGDLLSSSNPANPERELCVVLKNYNVKFPKESPWMDTTYIPYKFEMNLSFDAVYATDNLPGQERIAQYGG